MIRERDPYERDRRLGRWFTLKDIHARDPEAALALQATVVIVDMRRDYMLGQIEWIGQAPQFEIVPLGWEIPLYVPQITRWRRVVQVSWQSPRYAGETARWTA